MNKQARTIYELVKGAHDAMRLDPAAAKPQIGAAAQKIERAINEAEREKRRDLADFGVGAIGFLDSMSKRDGYLSAFAAGLDALGRRAGNVAE